MPLATPPLSSYPPVQQRILELLGRNAAETPPCDHTVVRDLRAELVERLAPAAALVPAGEQLWVGKTPLTTFGVCERRWQATREQPFRWNVPAVRGTVAHKAIELQANWRGEAPPAVMVDEAITRLLESATSVGEFLRSLSTVELAELRADALGFVTAFEECFPPVKARWRPVFDGSLRVPICDGRIVLSGKPDLTLGSPHGSGKVIIDLKTGHQSAHHRDDLRFYALLDSLRLGVPPRRVATLYLDSGQPSVETITADVLRAAVERVVRTVTAMVEVRRGDRSPEVRPAPACRWCPALESCEAGQEHLATATDDEGGW